MNKANPRFDSGYFITGIIIIIIITIIKGSY